MIVLDVLFDESLPKEFLLFSRGHPSTPNNPVMTTLKAVYEVFAHFPVIFSSLVLRDVFFADERLSTGPYV